MSSNNRFEFQGLAELREALRNLPTALTGEASHIIEGAANSATAQIKRNYASVSGDLVEGVRADFQRGQFSAGAKITSAAKHAVIYENGTQVRHTSTGANRGAMPPAPPGRAFIPVLRKTRLAMYAQFRALLERHGLVVTGDAR